MGSRRVAVVASAQTELRTAWSDAQHIDLISAVVSSVFIGTGLTLDDVDFVIDSGSDVLDGRSISNCGFLGALGAHHKEEARVEEDGLWAAQYGVNKIRSGASSLGLIVAYSKPSESNVEAYWASQCEPFYQRPVGFGQRAANGIQAQRYLADSGTSELDLAELVARRWADAASYGDVEIDVVPDSEAVLEFGRRCSAFDPPDAREARRWRCCRVARDRDHRASIEPCAGIRDRHGFGNERPCICNARQGRVRRLRSGCCNGTAKCGVERCQARHCRSQRVLDHQRANGDRGPRAGAVGTRHRCRQ